jgi:uncharacterized membrane protein
MTRRPFSTIRSWSSTPSSESDPGPKLNLIVSLEAILSTFAMIGQNRQAASQRAKAGHDFATGAQELQVNTELAPANLALTSEIRRHVVVRGPRVEPGGAP